MTPHLPSLSLASFALAGLAAAATTPKVDWAPCPAGEFNTTLRLQCGTLTVPLDYTGTAESARDKTIYLQLVKVLAPTQPSRGGIQMNFGGPGSPARGGTVLYGELLQAYVLPLSLFCVFLMSEAGSFSHGCGRSAVINGSGG